MFYEHTIFIAVGHMHLKVHEDHVIAIERVVHLKGCGKLFESVCKTIANLDITRSSINKVNGQCGL